MTALITLEGIIYAYPGAPPVLDGASLTVHAGERIALVGANGAGKTTLFQIMVGLIRPQAGRVTAFGALCRNEADFRPVRRRVGLLFQDSDDQLFCPTVIEDVAFGPLNLGHPPTAARLIAETTLARLGLEGLATRVTHKLSGGQKRLVALASVLAMDPDLLLLDEPTNALDAPTAARLIAILQALPQALLVISHDERFLAQITHRRVELSAGKIKNPSSASPQSR